MGGVEFLNVEDGWARDLRFLNADNAVMVAYVSRRCCCVGRGVLWGRGFLHSATRAGTRPNFPCWPSLCDTPCVALPATQSVDYPPCCPTAERPRDGQRHRDRGDAPPRLPARGPRRFQLRRPLGSAHRCVPELAQRPGGGGRCCWVPSLARTSGPRPVPQLDRRRSAPPPPTSFPLPHPHPATTPAVPATGNSRDVLFSNVTVHAHMQHAIGADSHGLFSVFERAAMLAGTVEMHR